MHFKEKAAVSNPKNVCILLPPCIKGGNTAVPFHKFEQLLVALVICLNEFKHNAYRE